MKCEDWLMTACYCHSKRPVTRTSDNIDTIRSSRANGRGYKLIYRRHISWLLSPGGRRAGVTEAFNLSLSADSDTTPARPDRQGQAAPHVPAPPPESGVGGSCVHRRR